MAVAGDRALARGVLGHLRDRRIVALTTLRLLACAALGASHAVLPLPGADRPAAAAAFLPLAVGVVGALGLRERLVWLPHVRRSTALLRLATSVAADLLTVAVLVAASGATSTGARLLPIAVVAATSYLAAIVSAEHAWLVATAVGIVVVVLTAAPGPSPTPAWNVPLAAAVWAGAATIHSFARRGPP